MLLLHILNDINFVGYDVSEADLLALQRRLCNMLNAAGLPVKHAKSTLVGTLAYKSLNIIGFDWDLREHVIVPKEKRAASVEYLSAISDGVVIRTPSGQFQRLVGKLAWTALARRSLLATLRASVKPNALDDLDARRIAAREIRLLEQLAPLARVRLHSPFVHLCIPTDASPWHGAACFSHVTERAAIGILKDAKHLKKMEWRVADTRFVEAFVKSRTWRRFLSHPWRVIAQINELEASVLLLVVWWLIRKQCCSMRVIVLSDSDLYIRAFLKGRSSVPRMLFAERRMAALLLAHDIALDVVHVPVPAPQSAAVRRSVSRRPCDRRSASRRPSRRRV